MWYKKSSAAFHNIAAFREKTDNWGTEGESIFFQAHFCQRNSMLSAMEMLHLLSSSISETSFLFLLM